MRSHKSLIIKLFYTIIILFFLVSCNSIPQKTNQHGLSVTILDGNNYHVVGDNKKNVEKGTDVSFEVELDRGYKIIGYRGDDCTISNNIGFSQTVSIDNVRFNSTISLLTEKLEEYQLIVGVDDPEHGTTTLESVLGNTKEGYYFDTDVISLKAIPSTSYKFWCWSIGNYMNNGGSYYSSDSIIEDLDFKNIHSIYANFKLANNLENSIVYSFDDNEIIQDCTKLLAHHFRANTFTANDIREYGIDCDSKMLVGWKTIDGEFVCLGSRVEVEKDSCTKLFPVWKDYTDASNFTILDNTITSYTGSDEEVIIPNYINDQKIEKIATNAFKNSTIKTVYIPDSVVEIDEYSFLDCKSLNTIYMSDNILNITDTSFAGCVNLKTVYLNAIFAPRYTDSFWGGKMESYDSLALKANRDKKRLIILGGSSVLHGYSATQAYSQFDEANIQLDEVHNIGFFAGVSGFAQFEIIKDYLTENDIFLHAPELENTPWFGEMKDSCINNDKGVRLNYQFYVLTESNLQFLSSLTINMYCNFFDMFKEWNNSRLDVSSCEYIDYFAYEADGKPSLSIESIGQERGLGENGEQPDFGYSMQFNDISASIQLAKENMYKHLIEKNVCVCVTFPPVDRVSLLHHYDSEEELQEAATNYTNQIKSILQDIDCGVISNQYSTIYDGEHFSDTYYHLGSPFRNTHTSNIIKCLIDYLEGRI